MGGFDTKAHGTAVGKGFAEQMRKQNAGIHPAQLMANIIIPALAFLDMDSPSARLLLIGTAAQESRCGHYLRQIGGGPALGIFQMEPATYRDIWDNYLRYKPDIKAKLAEKWPMQPEPEEMVSDMLLAAVMCRLHYRRVSQPLPQSNDERGLAIYWKNHYNTSRGKGTVAEFEGNYKPVVVMLGEFA